MIKLYRLNTGSCGGCDLEIDVAVSAAADLEWAATPQEADALLLTGPITAGSGGSVLALVRELDEPPLLAVGRCAIDGQPFGAGGVEALSSLVVRLRVEGCPITPEALAGAVRGALGIRKGEGQGRA